MLVFPPCKSAFVHVALSRIIRNYAIISLNTNVPFDDQNIFLSDILYDSDVYWTVHHCYNWRIKKPTRVHLLFYCASYRLNMFRALLCSSSGARDYAADYVSLQPGHYSSLTAPYLQHTANQERYDQCGNQQHSRELLMMSIVMLETCWAYKKHNKITSGIRLVFYSSVILYDVRFSHVFTTQVCKWIISLTDKIEVPASTIHHEDSCPN